MLFVFATCRQLIRTLPVMQHDRTTPRTSTATWRTTCADELRYACMSRPFRARKPMMHGQEPLLVANVFTIGVNLSNGTRSRP